LWSCTRGPVPSSAGTTWNPATRPAAAWRARFTEASVHSSTRWPWVTLPSNGRRTPSAVPTGSSSAVSARCPLALPVLPAEGHPDHLLRCRRVHGSHCRDGRLRAAAAWPDVHVVDRRSAELRNARAFYARRCGGRHLLLG